MSDAKMPEDAVCHGANPMKTIADAAERIVQSSMQHISRGQTHGWATLTMSNERSLKQSIYAELAAIVEERDARIRQLEEQLAAAESELRQRRSVDAAVTKVLEEEGVIVELEGRTATIIANFGATCRLGEQGKTWYAALSALVGVEQEEIPENQVSI